MDLDRYTELANMVLENKNPEQKHKGLSNLIDEVSNDLPDVITQQHRELLMSNTTLRFSDYWSDVLHPYGEGNVFHGCVSLLTKHRDEVEQFERDDEATIAMRKAKLKQYAQVINIQTPPKEIIIHNGRKEIIREPDPDRIYCQHGTYRKFDQYKNLYYYKLGRMIQNANADNGNLKTRMQLACLIVALNNERSIVEDELRLLGFEIPKIANNKSMHYYNITDLRESAGGYKMLTKYDPEFVKQSPEHYRIAEPIEQLHNAIDELSFIDNGKLVIKTDEIRNVLDAYNPNQEHIAESLSNVIEVVTDLRDHVGEHMGALLRIDTDASNVFCFLNAIVPILEKELQRVIERKKYAPTKDDEKAFKDKLIPFIEGKYGDMSFDTFISRFIINNVADLAKKRRLKHLIANCNDDGIKEQLRRYLEQCEMEIADHNIEQMPEPQPSPSVEESTKDDAPDFSHMESFKPTIKFDMLALYSFLKDQGVVVDIKYSLFCDCISHAHINELWYSNHVIKKRKRNLLQCLFKMLAQEYYPEEWIARCAKNLDKDKKNITNPTTSGATVKFENKLRDILKGKKIQ